MQEIKILLVEDEKKIADAVAMGLYELGYTVEVAYDGKIGQRIFESADFDLVILDINLPGINGFELCKLIRRKNKAIPVIMLTALQRLADKVEGFEAGADDYIPKPFEFKELVIRIKALLNRTMNQFLPAGNLLRIEDLELNLETSLVSRNGTPITLTAKEFQLLEYFMKNRNKVISRAEIAEMVWGGDFESKTNVIDVYVNFLRKKIDKGFDPKLIHTQVGQGYIMKG